MKPITTQINGTNKGSHRDTFDHKKVCVLTTHYMVKRGFLLSTNGKGTKKRQSICKSQVVLFLILESMPGSCSALENIPKIIDPNIFIPIGAWLLEKRISLLIIAESLRDTPSSGVA